MTTQPFHSADVFKNHDSERLVFIKNAFKRNDYFFMGGGKKNHEDIS